MRCALCHTCQLSDFRQHRKEQAVLLELRRTCQRLGKTLVVQGMPTHLGDLATLYGIEALLPRP